MKKLLIFCLLIVFSITGCSSSDTVTENKDSNESDALAEKEAYEKLLEENSITVELTMNNIYDYVGFASVEGGHEDSTEITEWMVIAISKMYDQGYVVLDEIDCEISYSYCGTHVQTSYGEIFVNFGNFNSRESADAECANYSITDVKGSIKFVKKDLVKKYSVKKYERTFDDVIKVSFGISPEHPY